MVRPAARRPPPDTPASRTRLTGPAPAAVLAAGLRPGRVRLAARCARPAPRLRGPLDGFRSDFRAVLNGFALAAVLAAGFRSGRVRFAARCARPALRLPDPPDGSRPGFRARLTGSGSRGTKIG
ncbi:hypothetical protein GCM10009759_27240 [Kitasatospora saccharophila]|uniref:Uncharacterized protein n=1 Tax=Kitasatospora saccharophila TaxID=407973 RepID=A0ABN2WS69_9ACTN